VGIVSNARQATRAAVIAEITAEARRQLAAQGAAALSLRAVARSLGMASSAIYRYVASRDELLTILIVEAYEALGAHVEAAAAAAAAAEAPAVQQWHAVCHAVRAWALQHPQEYGLLFGAPVPGYHAPETTVAPASRVTRVLAGVLLTAYQSGQLKPARPVPVSPAVTADARHLAKQMGITDLSDSLVRALACGLVTWAQLFGQINFEVFGRYEGLVQDTEALFEHAVTLIAVLLGFDPPTAPAS
jgi:AcrR family transcriptional regulator